MFKAYQNKTMVTLEAVVLIPFFVIFHDVFTNKTIYAKPEENMNWLILRRYSYHDIDTDFILWCISVEAWIKEYYIVMSAA